MADVAAYTEKGEVLESFGVGTAVIVAPIAKIGWQGKDILLPEQAGGLGPVGKGLWSMITDIQTGVVEFQGWSVVCDSSIVIV